MAHITSDLIWRALTHRLYKTLKAAEDAHADSPILLKTWTSRVGIGVPELEDAVNEWLSDHPDIVVLQLGNLTDNDSISLWYRE
tara:strand:+ start:470 stop:721 length:252 start_codon:yes stop_codon:yes gene_type:complete